MHNGTSSQHASTVLYTVDYRAGSLVSLLVSQYSQQRSKKRKDPVIYVHPHSVRVLFSYQLLSNKSGSSHARTVQPRSRTFNIESSLNLAKPLCPDRHVNLLVKTWRQLTGN